MVVILVRNDAATPTLRQYYILFHWAVVGISFLTNELHVQIFILEMEIVNKNINIISKKQEEIEVNS